MKRFILKNDLSSVCYKRCCGNVDCIYTVKSCDKQLSEKDTAARNQINEIGINHNFYEDK